MNVKVLSKDGKETGREINLSDAVFSIEPNDHAVYLSVKSYLAAQRQGTHKSTEKWEVARTTKKAFRQKGTGGARRGSMKAPGLKGGGRAFGPKPHTYDLKVNKKVKDLAKKSALTYKAKDNAIAVVEDFKLDDNKTKNYFQILKNLGVSKSKTLVVVGEADKNLRLASRNVSNSRVTRASDLNTYDILNCKSLLLTEGSLKNFEN